MTALFEISTWAWIAGVFVIIKLLFKYLAWLYPDKDKTLRQNVDEAWLYLSQHSYFEVVRATLARLYDRLCSVFRKRIRFLYLFVFFFLLNLASLLAGKYWIGLNLAEVQHVFTVVLEAYGESLPTEMSEIVGLPKSLAALFQLSLLDLCSLLLTIGIIWAASRSRKAILLLAELIIDVCVLASFSVFVFQLLYFWLLNDFYTSFVGSFHACLLIVTLIWLAYMVRRHLVQPDFFDSYRNDPFLPLSIILLLCGVVYIIMLPRLLVSSFDNTSLGLNVFSLLVEISMVPIILLFCCLPVFRMRAESKLMLGFKIFLLICFLGFLCHGVYSIVANYSLVSKLYSAYISSRATSNYVFILVVSSGLPTLAHLIALAVVIIAKAMPRKLQRFINNHLAAMKKSDEKVLSQLGNAFGGIGALITAIIQLV